MKPVKLRLKIDLVSYPARAEGLVNMGLCSYDLLIPNNSQLKIVAVFNWNHFEMRLLNQRINFLFIADFFFSSWLFLCCFFFHYVSAKFHLWPSGPMAQRIEALSLYGSR